jgi:hypothetical protein
MQAALDWAACFARYTPSVYSLTDLRQSITYAVVFGSSATDAVRTTALRTAQAKCEATQETQL